MPRSREVSAGLELHVGHNSPRLSFMWALTSTLERSKVLKRNSQKSLSPEAGIATGKSTSSLVLGTSPSDLDPFRKAGAHILRNGLSPHRAVACDSYFAGTERSSRRAPFLAT